MKFGRYLALMASTWVLAALAVAAFTLLVDAIGISPVRVAIAGFNAWKPLRQDYDWIAKRYDVWRGQPATIFHGVIPKSSSQSIPSLWPGPHSRPLTMAALMAVRNSRRSAPIFRTICGRIKNLHHVFIEVFAPVLFANPQSATPLVVTGGQAARPPVIEFGHFADISDFGSIFFSVGGLGSAIRTVSMNRRNPAAVSFEDGFAPIPLAPHHFSVKNVFNFVLHTGFMQRGAVLPSAPMAAARRMIEDCNRHQVECRFFVSSTARRRAPGSLPFGPVAGTGEGQARTCGTCTDLRLHALQPVDRRTYRTGRVLAGGVSLFGGIGRIDGASNDRFENCGHAREFRRGSRFRGMSIQAWPLGAKSGTSGSRSTLSSWHECESRKTTFAMASPSRRSRMRK